MQSNVDGPGSSPGRTGDVRVLDKALDILLTFNRTQSEQGPSDVALRLGIPRSTAHRVMNTLARRGFLERDEQTGRYQLGALLLRLGSQVAVQQDLRRAALPELRALQASTGEAVNLNVVYKGERLCLEKIDSRHELQAQIQVGSRAPLYAAAASRVLLAYLPAEEQERVLRDLRAVTEQTITCAEDLRADLAQIRLRGYAVSEGEMVPGVASVAAPVRDHTGQVVASISCGGPSVRFPPDRMPALIRETVQAAADISARLGFLEGESS